MFSTQSPTGMYIQLFGWSGSIDVPILAGLLVTVLFEANDQLGPWVSRSEWMMAGLAPVERGHRCVPSHAINALKLPSPTTPFKLGLASLPIS